MTGCLQTLPTNGSPMALPSRVDRRVVRVVLYVQGEGFVVAAAVAVIGCDLQGDGFFVRVVKVFAIFEFERAVAVTSKRSSLTL